MRRDGFTMIEVLAALVILGIGIWSYQHLPIDAVPDITNVQVQINTAAPGYSPLEAEDNVRHTLSKEMSTEANMLEEMGYTVEREVGFGEPAQQILFYADLAKADLIAMTTHGREGLSRLMAGSVAESVLHKAKMPVLMVRPQTIANEE